jgi:general nucleoside transport system permease protein
MSRTDASELSGSVRTLTGPRGFHFSSLPRWLRSALSALGVVLLLAIAGRLFDAPGLTGSSTVGTAVGLAVPVILAGLGGLVAERAGVFNIGLEGMMAMGTWGAGFLGWHYGPWGALLGGLLGGIIGGALLALATVTFAIEQTVAGVAINIASLGICRYLSSLFFEGKGPEGDLGTIADSPSVRNFGSRFSVPFIGDPLLELENKQWFLLSDFAGVIRGFTVDVAWASVLLLLLVPAIWYLVWRTPFGLRLRSSGEKPAAAESLGVNVIGTRWIAVVMSGGLAGLAGSWLVLESLKYQQGMTSNRGYLGLAAMIFGNWMPGLLSVGALLFSFSQSVGFQLGFESRAIIGAVGMVFILSAIWSAIQRKLVSALIIGIVGAGVLWFAILNETVNDALIKALPYLLTLIVLAVASKRQRPPAAAGIPYIKGRAG